MTPAHSKKVVKVATTAWSALGVLGILPALFTIKMLSAPGAVESLPTIILVVALASFPIVCLAAILISQRAISSEKYRRACGWACLPLVNIVIGGLALIWINYFEAAAVAA